MRCYRNLTVVIRNCETRVKREKLEECRELSEEKLLMRFISLDSP